jgi:hypothetical protein
MAAWKVRLQLDWPPCRGDDESQMTGRMKQIKASWKNVDVDVSRVA